MISFSYPIDEERVNSVDRKVFWKPDRVVVSGKDPNSIAIGFGGNALDIAQIDRGFTQLPRHAHQTLNRRQPDINRAGCEVFIDRVTTIS